MYNIHIYIYIYTIRDNYISITRTHSAINNSNCNQKILLLENEKIDILDNWLRSTRKKNLNEQIDRNGM